MHVLFNVKVHRRPSIEEVLQDPRVQRQQQLMEGRFSGSRESDNSKSTDDFRVREKKIEAKEKELESKLS